MKILETIFQRQNMSLVELDGCFVFLSESSRNAIKKKIETHRYEGKNVGNICQVDTIICTKRLLTN